MNLAQLYDPASRRLAPERADLPEVLPPRTEPPTAPVVRRHYQNHRDEPMLAAARDRASRRVKTRKLSAVMSEMREGFRRLRAKALDKDGGWASWERVRAMFPRVDRSVLKLRLFRGVERGILERRGAKPKQREYRLVAEEIVAS